ncbi:MAG: glycosyltransferase family 39 protein [bacterium]
MDIAYEDLKKQRDRVVATLLLFVLVCFLAITNLIWLANDSRPPSWDQSTHLRLSIEYFDIITQPSLDMFGRLLDVSSYYPPFYHITLIPSHLLFGVSHSGAAMTNIFYLALAAFFTYKIGKHFFDSTVGLVAAFLVSMYQFPIYLSRSCLIDVALMAIVTMTIYFLIMSEDFSRRDHSIIFGILFGIGMLTKWSFLFFLIIPVSLVKVRIFQRIEGKLLFYLYSVLFLLSVFMCLFFALPYNLIFIFGAFFVLWRLAKLSKANFEVHENIKNLCMAAWASFVIAGPWYLHNFTKLFRHVTSNVGTIAVSEGDPSLFSLSSVFYYFKELAIQVQLVFFILFIIGLVIFLVKWKKERILLLLWIVAPYIILILVRNKDARFSIPYLPAVSIISVAFISLIEKKLVKKLIIACILIVGVTQYLLFSFSFSAFPSRVGFSTPIGNLSLYSSYVPKDEDWMHREIFSKIVRDSNSSGRPFALVRVVSNHPYFHSSSFEIYTLVNKLAAYPISYNKNVGEFTDYLIYKTGNRGPAFTVPHYDEVVHKIEKKEASFANMFSVLDEFALPDGSTGIVYKRDIKPVEDVSIDQIRAELKKSLASLMGVREGLNVDIIAFSQTRTKQGKFKKVIISAENIIINGVGVEKMRVEVGDLWLSIGELMERSNILVFGIEQISPEIVISEQSLKNFVLAKDKNKVLKDTEVFLRDGLLQITGNVRIAGLRLPVLVEGSVYIDRDKNALITRVKTLRAGPFVLPAFLYGSFVNREFSLEPTADWALRTNIKEVVIDDGKLILR